MTSDRKTLAKYGAKSPAARSTGAKPAPPARQAGPADAPVKADPADVKKGGDKKR